VTRTGARRKARAAANPPKPPPTMTTSGNAFSAMVSPFNPFLPFPYLQELDATRYECKVCATASQRAESRRSITIITLKENAEPLRADCDEELTTQYRRVTRCGRVPVLSQVFG